MSAARRERGGPGQLKSGEHPSGRQAGGGGEEAAKVVSGTAGAGTRRLVGVMGADAGTGAGKERLAPDSARVHSGVELGGVHRRGELAGEGWRPAEGLRAGDGW
jgi:hypothetical protein